MRKLAIIFAAIAVLAGCQKEETNSLIGTKWETTGYSLIDALVGWKYHIYEFTDINNVDSYWLDRNGKVASFDGTYKYTIEEPYVIIEEDDNTVKLEMTNKMTMVVTTNESIKYLKQQ